MDAPQANDIDKILDLPLAVADGVNTKYSLAKRYTFDEREADYYLTAGEILGLVQRKDGLCILTEDGKKYCRMDPMQQKLMVIRKMVSSQVVALIIAELVASDKKVISKDEIERLIEEPADVHRETLSRRTECLMKWFAWIGSEVGVFSADSDTVRISTVGMDTQ